MTRDMVKALPDGELAQVVAWAQEEQKERAEKRKQDTIARIRDLARSIDVNIRIEGTRGRPPKAERSSDHKARPEAALTAKPSQTADARVRS